MTAGMATADAVTATLVEHHGWVRQPRPGAVLRNTLRNTAGDLVTVTSDYGIFELTILYVRAARPDYVEAVAMDPAILPWRVVRIVELLRETG